MITATSWISTRPGRCGGDACVRETRIPVWALVERRRVGRTDEEIIRDLPDLTLEDLSVAWKYAEDHAREIEQTLWQNEACMVEKSDRDEIHRLIRQGIRLEFSDDAIRDAFYPALGREDLAPILRSLRAGYYLGEEDDTTSVLIRHDPLTLSPSHSAKTMTPLPKMVPHTAAKHLLLKQYLDRWFPIIGKYNQRINYIDGFAGPGEYEGGEPGSPLLAIEAAKYHVEHGTLDPNVEINFGFVEASPDYARHLQGKLDALARPAQFKVEIIQGEFAAVIGGRLDEIEKGSLRLAPTFAFVDPFGFSGIPFDLMARILAHPKCEVFVNIMTEFINRFLEHPNDKVLAHFPSTFGTNEVLNIPSQMGDRIGAILSLYRRQLKSKAKFVGRFDMHGRNDQKNYSLFFASNSPKGFEKMKEAMWSVDKVEGVKFSDFEPGAADQPTLFGCAALWEEMLVRFRGRKVPMADLERFVIEQTDYLPKHARSLLTEKEGNEIGVEVVQGEKRRKGTYPVGKVDIVFPA